VRVHSKTMRKRGDTLPWGEILSIVLVQCSRPYSSKPRSQLSQLSQLSQVFCPSSCPPTAARSGLRGSPPRITLCGDGWLGSAAMRCARCAIREGDWQVCMGGQRAGWPLLSLLLARAQGVILSSKLSVRVGKHGYTLVLSLISPRALPCSYSLTRHAPFRLSHVGEKNEVSTETPACLHAARGSFVGLGRLYAGFLGLDCSTYEVSGVL
jgi:hypothetical protein